MVYLWGMKMYSIDIIDSQVFTEVYRLTANAAVQRGDDNAVATSDNEGMLSRFITEGRRRLVAALGRYSKGGLEYAMPENWLDRSEDINELAESFLTNYTIAKWYELNGTGEKFIEAANEALMVIKDILNRREKPL